MKADNVGEILRDGKADSLIETLAATLAEVEALDNWLNSGRSWPSFK